MLAPHRPELRPLESTPIGPREEQLYLFRDPQGYGDPLVLPYGAVVLASMMNGQRSLLDIQTIFQARTDVPVALADLERIVEQLDEACLLSDERFEQRRREQVDRYLANPIRPAVHAGAAYAQDPAELRAELAGYFSMKEGLDAAEDAAAPTDRLRAIISPHIDPYRGGNVYASAYRQVAEHCDADLFVIFGSSHNPMSEPYCISRKDFDTPLGTVPTDRAFADRVAEHLASSVAGRSIDLAADEVLHRFEHSIEFQAVMLQYILGGRRDFRIVPVLTASYQPFLDEGSVPDESPEVQAFVAAVQAAAESHPGSVCYVAAADLAHIGARFGDPWLLDADRLAYQASDDRQLLELVCNCDAAGFYHHVAWQRDGARICGLSPIHTMLLLMQEARGQLLCYDQAVDPNDIACVSFASVAFWRQ